MCYMSSMQEKLIFFNDKTHTYTAVSTQISQKFNSFFAEEFKRTKDLFSTREFQLFVGSLLFSNKDFPTEYYSTNIKEENESYSRVYNLLMAALNEYPDNHKDVKIVFIESLAESVCWTLLSLEYDNA